MQPFAKVVNPFKTRDSGEYFCEIKWDGKRLSICGVEGPLKNGDRKGGCGQIGIHMDRVGAVPEPWTLPMIEEFGRIWERWHLNDMIAGSPAQEDWLRANPVDAKYPKSHYEEACKALAAAGLHPDPNNGYKYGSAWLLEEVPEEALAFLVGLPASQKTPAWV